jgi:hypothetical protein
MTVVSQPTPPYSNPPIQPQFYAPSRFSISNISTGNTTVITATANMNYYVGQLVRILIPPAYGIRQLNEQEGYVISLPAPNQVEVNINSNFYDSYVAAVNPQSAQILAIGNVNSGATNTSRASNQVFINGSFMDISP